MTYIRKAGWAIAERDPDVPYCTAKRYEESYEWELNDFRKFRRTVSWVKYILPTLGEEMYAGISSKTEMILVTTGVVEDTVYASALNYHWSDWDEHYIPDSGGGCVPCGEGYPFEDNFKYHNNNVHYLGCVTK